MKKASKGAGSKKPADASEDGDFQSEYDFSSGVRGKYAERFAGSNFIVLDPDLAAEFPDSESVAKALRAYLKSKSRKRSA